MLEVLPIQDKSAQETICLKCGVEYKPEMMAYSATVDGKLVGVCQFTMSDKGGMLADLANIKGLKDTQALFVLGRAMLNFVDLCGVHYAYCASDEIDAVLLRAIGFSMNSDGIYDVDLTHFFDHPCQHNK